MKGDGIIQVAIVVVVVGAVVRVGAGVARMVAIGSRVVIRNVIEVSVEAEAEVGVGIGAPVVVEVEDETEVVVVV